MKTKKKMRSDFNSQVFKRDKNKCLMCGKTGRLDAHHIIDRSEIPNGGYVVENGITLCAGDDQNNCHWKAEQLHCTGVPYPGYRVEDLFNKIGSSLEMAVEAATNSCCTK